LVLLAIQTHGDTTFVIAVCDTYYFGDTNVVQKPFIPNWS